MKQKKKKILAVGIVLLVFALVASIGAVAIMKMNSPIEKLKRALNEKDFKEVQTLYEENLSDADFKSQADDVLLNFINSSYEKYLNKEETFNAVVDSLKAMKFFGEEPNALIKQMRKINKSRADYTNAEQEFLSGNYEKAIELYRSVTKEDSQNYTMAQQNIEDCISAIRNQAKEKATALKEAGNCKEVVLFIDNFSKEYIDDELLKIKSDAVSQLEVKASDYESEGKYAEAISLLTDEKGNPIDNSVSTKVRLYKKEMNIKELKSLKQYVSVEYDSIDKDYTIRFRDAGSTFPTNNRSIISHITVDSSTTFAILFGFLNRDWIFTDSIIIDCGKKQFTLPVDRSASQRDVLWGGICERMVYIHNKWNSSIYEYYRDLEEIVKSMGEAEKVTIRFKGSGGHKDVTIPSAHIEQVCNLWKVYQILEEDRTLISQLT